MTQEVIGFIFARGGSKGVPRKNICPLGGKPLIAYAIETAKASKFIHRVIVSTDDREIARVALQYGAEVPFMRPAELAGDSSPELMAWRHALIEVEKSSGHLPDIFVSIPTTSPLRNSSDVDRCISCLLESNADIVVTVKKADRNPYFNMVTVDTEGNAHLVISTGTTVIRRQDAPVMYDMTTVAYAARPVFILREESMFKGTVKAIEIPPERAVDIDTELDFAFAEFLLATGRVSASERKVKL